MVPGLTTSRLVWRDGFGVKVFTGRSRQRPAGLRNSPYCLALAFLTAPLPALPNLYLKARANGSVSGAERFAIDPLVLVGCWRHRPDCGFN